jgi:hypothetical protein
MAKVDLPTGVIGGLGLAVLAGFAVGLTFAAYTTLTAGPPDPASMPTIVNFFLSSVNGTLALNLGAYLGMRGVGQELTGPVGWLQKVAAVMYAVAVIGSGVVWASVGCTEDTAKVAAVIPEISRSGLGIVLAIFGAALGVSLIAEARRRDVPR